MSKNILICFFILFSVVVLLLAGGKFPMSVGGYEDRWAIVLATGHTNDIEAHEPMADAMKKVLLEGGWREDHIRCLRGYDATFGNFRNELQWLIDHSDDDDLILVYINTHGDRRDFGIWHDDFHSLGEFFYSELDDWFDQMLYDGLVFMTAACYSGGSIPEVEGTNRVILTACASNEENVLGVWSTHCFWALQCLGDYNGDNDGWVSAEEVHRYAVDLTDTHPQMSDNYVGELQIVYISEHDDAIDQQHYNRGHAYTIRTDNQYAQSFKPKRKRITKIMVPLWVSHEGTSQPVTVSIRAGLRTESMERNYVDLRSVTVTPEYVDGGMRALLMTCLDFDDLIIVPEDELYIVFKSISCGLPYSPDGAYGRGNLYKGANGDYWMELTGKDCAFVVFSTDDIGELHSPTANFEYELWGSTDIVFKDLSLDIDGYIRTYHWDFGDGATSDEKNPAHTYEPVGNYVVSLTVTDSSELTDTTTKTITYYPIINGAEPDGIPIEYILAGVFVFIMIIVLAKKK